MQIIIFRYAAKVDWEQPLISCIFWREWIWTSQISFIFNGFVGCDPEEVASVTGHCQLRGGITSVTPM